MIFLKDENIEQIYEIDKKRKENKEEEINRETKEAMQDRSGEKITFNDTNILFDEETVEYINSKSLNLEEVAKKIEEDSREKRKEKRRFRITADNFVSICFINDFEEIRVQTFSVK
jgi:hypothetical protein